MTKLLNRLCLFGSLCCTLWVHSAAAADAPLGLPALEEMAKTLRAGDYALVRIEPTDETAEQQNIVCPSKIPSLAATVCDSKSDLKTRGTAAEVLTLCTTNNPKNREAIGTASGGDDETVHSGLIQLIRDGQKVLEERAPEYLNDEEPDEALVAAKAVGNAAEAIYILTFNSGANHAKFVEQGAVATLGEVLVEPHCDRRHLCSRPIMWSAAALQNLAASYCESETGTCWWEWTESNKGYSDDILTIREVHGKMNVDGQAVREQIMKLEDLLNDLEHFTCQGPVYLPHLHFDEDDESYTAWPLEAEVAYGDDEGEEDSPSIIPWAAAGVIKNLALAGPKVRNVLLEMEHLQHCLCGMQHSPDLLESEKAYEALYYLGIAEECPPLYDESCRDYSGWKDEESETCAEYEEYKWCVQHGENTNAEGITANEACCACGGGNEEGDEL